jgi:hypothetical protein
MPSVRHLAAISAKWLPPRPAGFMAPPPVARRMRFHTGDSGQRWMPHSVLPVPAQRPLRGCSPGSTRLVQGEQPIDGYPS